ncbi:hypothetical protein V491_00416 [Pseudogymnoascus sp. VKM F-3775]|nr:hypothetical protein V491_00416 [Pseudogymnoascus sp. VKM F-3775]
MTNDGRGTDWEEGRISGVAGVFRKTASTAATYILSASTLQPTSSDDDYVLGDWAGTEFVSPAADEAKLRLLLWATDQMFARAEDTLRQTHHRLCCWLRTYHLRHFQPVPFQPLQTDAGRTSYIAIWKRFICYIFRVWATGEPLRQEIYRVQFREQEAALMESIWEALPDSKGDRLEGPGKGNTRGIREHLKACHQWESGDKGGRPSKVLLASHDQRAQKESVLSAVIVAPVSYQTFHRSNFTRFFEVATLLEPNVRPLNLPSSPLSLEEQVEAQLAEKTRAFDERASHNLGDAAQLVALPHSFEPEPELVAILGSFDRLIDQARDSVLQCKINAFDQQRINSFLRAGSRTSKASDRPLAHKLKEGTYRKYKKTGKQLLCFVFRMVYLGQQPSLHCLITSAQSAALDNVTHAARIFIQQREHDVCEELGTAQIRAQERTLDSACLRLWIALLDHRLMGDIYDSVVVGFLAVLGIDAAREGFQEATTYTPHLSALIKISQMLVLQRAVIAAEEGETEYPAQMIETMQDRFMAYSSRSPINWAQKLRVYGKKIRDSTTSLGYIVWSDDGQKLNYKRLELRRLGQPSE